MYVHEEKMDLFKAPQGYHLAHCISTDFALGAGVAKQIDAAFNMRNKLKSRWSMPNQFKWPCCLTVGNVFNLVTKEKYWHKPTLETLEAALKDMRAYAINMQVTRIAMPRIGCGLDKLSWKDVKPMIEEIFQDTDIEIMICVL